MNLHDFAAVATASTTAFLVPIPELITRIVVAVISGLIVGGAMKLVGYALKKLNK